MKIGRITLKDYLKAKILKSKKIYSRKNYKISNE